MGIDISNDFGDFSQQLQSLGVVLQHHLDQLATKARAKAPVDTGFLRSNIQVLGVTFADDVLRGEILSKAEYGSHQEFGPKPGNPRPWRFTPHLRPALDEQLESMVTDILQDLELPFGEVEVTVETDFES